jgi:hypothetical protein
MKITEFLENYKLLMNGYLIDAQVWSTMEQVVSVLTSGQQWPNV